MRHKLHLDICDIPICLDIDDSSVFRHARGRYSVYLTKKPQRIYIEVETRKSNIIPPSQQEPKVTVSDNGNAIHIHRYDISAGIDVRKKKGWLIVNRGAASIDSFLRILYSILLLRKKAFLIHSAGLRINNSAFLFPGQSGAGKTTLYKKAGRRFILSDELNMVRANDSGFYAKATPFMGEFRKGVSNEGGNMRGIFFLSKGAPNYYRPIAKDDALTRMLSTVMFFSDQLEMNRKLLTIVSRFVNNLPTFELQYDKDTTRFADIRDMISGALDREN